MLNQFSRSSLLLGKDGMEKLKNATVAVFGIGGVGSFTAEALARCGVGHLVLVDDDKVCLTNINRQLIALHSTVGKPKVEVMKERILDINKNAVVDTHPCFFGEDTKSQFDFSAFTYVADAIDTITAKLILIQCANAANVPIISCMSAGNKLDPTAFEVADIYETTVCPIAKVMRKELRVRDIKSLKVVYSKEVCLAPNADEEQSCRSNCICPDNTKRTCTVRRQIPGSVSFVPSVAGLILAGEIIKDIIKKSS